MSSDLHPSGRLTTSGYFSCQTNHSHVKGIKSPDRFHLTHSNLVPKNWPITQCIRTKYGEIYILEDYVIKLHLSNSLRLLDVLSAKHVIIYSPNQFGLLACLLATQIVNFEELYN